MNSIGSMTLNGVMTDDPRYLCCSWASCLIRTQLNQSNNLIKAVQTYVRDTVRPHLSQINMKLGV